MRAPQEVLDNNSTVQTKASSGHTPAVTPNVANGIQTLRVGGQPLPESTRSYFEPRFGHDFSQVRIHVDNRAAELASRINAKAFSFGEDVVFGSGQYQPHSHEGRRLLAHELTHVVQQAGGGVTVVQSAPPMVARQVGGRDPALLSDEELHREYNALRSFLLEADPNSLGYEELVRDVDRLEAEMLSPRPVPDERERVEGSMPPAPATGGGTAPLHGPASGSLIDLQTEFLHQFGIDPSELPSGVEEQIAEGFKRITQAVSGQEAPLLGEGEGLVIESHTSSEGVDEQVAYVDVDGVRIRVYQRHDRNTGELITEFGYVSASGDSVTASRSETLGRGSLGVEEEVNPRFETVPLVVPPPPGPVAAPSPPRSAAAEEGGGLTKLLVGESAVDFFVDALVGEYSQDASLGSIALDTGITLIPVVDQVGDARDLSAHLYYLIVNGEYDQAMRWVGLVLTAVGAIPEVGTAIKGTLRLLLRAAKGVAENAGEIVRLLRRLMPDFADDLPAMVRWIRNNWPAWRAAAREIAVRSIDNATLLASRVSDNAARVRRIAGQKIDEALDLAWAQVNEALDRLAREFGVDDLQFGPRLAPAGGPPMPPTRLPEGPRQLEPMQMSGSRDLDEIMGEPQSLDETLEHLGRTANPTGRGEVGSRRVDAYEPRIENPAETALMKAQAHEAFQKFVDDGFMPPGTQVRSVRVQRTTAGRAQQAATSRRGLAQTPEFEPHFTLLSGRSFQPDDIIPEGASGYRFGDHKTLLNRDRSFYLTEKGEQALRTRFQRDLEVFEETSASGCRGWLYTTDDLALYEVIERLVIEMDGGRGILSVAAR